MKFFADSVIKPYVRQRGYSRLCEIGASYGETTDALLALPSLTVDIVDPCLDADLAKKYERDVRIRVHKGISLQILPTLTDPFDCILIDGDHNWYTVFNELKTIEERELLEAGGTIFFHDIGWPYGRRDMYYQPEVIPESHRHPFKRSGLVYGQSALSDDSESNRHLANSMHEGGPCNGVLTAIEDFLKESRASYRFRQVAGEYGLGLMLKPRNWWDALRFSLSLNPPRAIPAR